MYCLQPRRLFLVSNGDACKISRE
uniref:Uncharacterized protein n=1 Tax=Rhizophora mucronata TaxID=61149 RepID=A0A2P2Q1A8_RHIMU